MLIQTTLSQKTGHAGFSIITSFSIENRSMWNELWSKKQRVRFLDTVYGLWANLIQFLRLARTKSADAASDSPLFYYIIF